MHCKKISVVIVFFLFGCTEFGAQIPSLAPFNIDQPIRSVEYYKEVYHVDLLTYKHKMSDELASYRQVKATCDKVLSRIKIMGASPKCPSKEELFTHSKRLSNNNYFIGLNSIPLHEKQKGRAYCWAACVQFMIAVKYGKYIDQDEILHSIKGGNAETLKDQAGTVLDTMRALHYGRLCIYPNGSYIILESLAKNQPVILGYRKDQQELGHAVVIVGARFSFTSAALPPWPVAGAFAFSELVVYDPATGDISEIQATEIENDVQFIIGFI